MSQPRAEAWDKAWDSKWRQIRGVLKRLADEELFVRVESDARLALHADALTILRAAGRREPPRIDSAELRHVTAYVEAMVAPRPLRQSLRPKAIYRLRRIAKIVKPNLPPVGPGLTDAELEEIYQLATGPS